MKFPLKFPNIIKVAIGFFICCLFYQNSKAQNIDKNTVRIQAYYTKIVDSIAYIDIKAVSKIDKKYERIPNIEVIIYNEIDDEKIKLGSSFTNNDGETRFIISNFNLLKPDSTNTYNLVLTFKGNNDFKKVSKNISFKNATIKTSLDTRNNINYLTVSLLNEDTRSPITNESMYLQVQRLFKPLKISDNYQTDEQGSIIIPIEDGIPGVNGILNLEIVLYESDDFGTVKNIVKAPIGVPIIDESTFDERTMWSPRNKTPLFLLIVPNLLTFAMWGFIVYFIINLFKIKNSQT